MTKKKNCFAPVHVKTSEASNVTPEMWNCRRQKMSCKTQICQQFLTRSPGSPGLPLRPGNPGSPGKPGSPGLPSCPWSPFSPFGPGAPKEYDSPFSPFRPGKPASPIGPFGKELILSVYIGKEKQTNNKAKISRHVFLQVFLVSL